MKVLKFSIILFLPNFLSGLLFGYFLLDNLYEPFSYYLLLELIGFIITAGVVYAFVKVVPNNYYLNILALTIINYLVPLALMVYLIGVTYFSMMVLFEFLLYSLSVLAGYRIALNSKKATNVQLPNKTL
ncbi:MAG: hypothetical protein HRU40_02905 [Saprospiraceae bacterium]|nr:hypothetical protein [Saprospiraceae bacterium]